MSEQSKVYVESYGILYEVIDPIFETDGAVTSYRWRAVGDEVWTVEGGTFLAPVIYENLFVGIAGFSTEGCDLADCCEDPEDCAQQAAICDDCAGNLHHPEDACTCHYDDPDDLACCGADEACSDCPDNDEPAAPLIVDITARTFVGQIAEALDALMAIAEDEDLAADSRIDAAATVIATYLRAFGV